MQLLGIYSDQILIITIFLLIVIVYLFWQTTFPHTQVRVRFTGGSEVTYNAEEVSQTVHWKDKHRNSHEAAIMTRPSIAVRFGVKYRIFEVIDGANVTTYSLDPAKVSVDANRESVLAAEIKETNMIKQLAAGLRSLSLMDRIIILLLGLFIGLFLYPILMSG